MSIFKTARKPIIENTPVVEAPVIETVSEVIAEFIANENVSELPTAVLEVVETPVVVETITAKKKSRKAKKVEAPVETAPVVEATVVAPVVATPVEAPKNIWGLAILPAVETTAPAKAKKAVTSGSAAARKAALETTDKTDRLERVIALMTRPEGASLRDIQTCYWLAAAAVRKLVEKEGYTTHTTGDRGVYRYHARKI